MTEPCHNDIITLVDGQKPMGGVSRLRCRVLHHFAPWLRRFPSRPLWIEPKVCLGRNQVYCHRPSGKDQG